MQTNKQSIFTKKNILFIITSFCFACLMVVVSVLFVLKIDFSTLKSTLKVWNKSNDKFILYIFALALFSVFRAVIFVLVIIIQAHKMKNKIKWYHYIALGWMIIFLSNVTPFAIGAEPYVIFFINKYLFKNIKQATAFWLVNNTFVQLAQIIITWPSFFYVTDQYLQLSYQNQFNFPYYYWLALGGLLLDIFVTSLYFVLAFSIKVHIFFHKVIIWFKKILHLKYLPKKQLKTNFNWYVRYYYYQKWLILMGLGVGFVYNFVLYSLIFIVFLWSDRQTNNLNFIDWYNFTNISVTATNFLPIPGSEGGVQFILKTFIQSLSNLQTTSSDVDIIVFLWRFFSAYTGTFIGLLLFMIYFPMHSYQYYQKLKKPNLKVFKFNF
ncbi:lysylphosphatidylglycerol synthase domain-containing protein [Ureaplasma sp. ES3154-GEN]|uniref:lysylphosphatidylglycerol synthase domain-containing protein n=1 Tax=Ureaplasma sp. ES3154-GEN TaxID=2984844 RepID=UPI0021E77363|nr:lysylphosphatidylglycerol synthase domain-containing protein [Ureaplasma sp. ES3154-GEN]MCV3743835.1 lysylphosphatidylglycerol synthase domain-containing protein [Ureaplasma sp. ES3154-GEN]